MSTNVDSIGLSSNVQQFVVYAVVNPDSMATTVDYTVELNLDSVGIGDQIDPVAPYDLEGIMATCAPSGEGTADLSLYNASTGTVDLDSGTWKFIVTRA